MPASAPIRDGTPNSSQWPLAPRPDVNTIIAGNPGSITNASDGRKWLDTKGWVLTAEDYDRNKMIDILLTVSLLPKMPMEAINAI